jgi:ferredoxin
MTHFNDRPVPMIDPQRCDGCGLCVRACPTKALGLQDSKAVVANPLACEYSGLCEAVCPTQAISRPFEIVIACIEHEEEISLSNSTKVVDKD